ncbi:hypothetical protein AYO36_16480 [Exiguobacterium sp. KKBO11]|nr:hypothetical protein AYO36_16480 [Exiguobacterium sp. KKBO11]
MSHWLGWGELPASVYSVIPALSRYPASPSPWAGNILFAAQTRVGWIPAHGRNDGSICREGLHRFRQLPVDRVAAMGDEKGIRLGKMAITEKAVMGGKR